MDAYLDNEPLESSVGEDERLEALLAEVNRAMSERDRVVVAILCNDQEVNADALPKALATPLSEFQRVELRSQPAGEVARAVLDQASGLLEETEREQPGIVEMLNEGNTVRGMELLAGSFRLWLQAHEAVLGAIRLGSVPLDDVRVDGTPSVDIVNGLKDKLEQIKEALEARDYVMLADILQYELPETLQTWKSLIGQLHQVISPERPSP